MTFLRRLKLYGIGFLLGLGIVYAIFGSRSCASPGEIKLNELVTQYTTIGEKAKCKMECMHMPEMLLKLYLRHFKINYDNSEVRAVPCGIYFVEPREEFKSKYQFKLVMYDCDTITRIDDIQLTSPLPDCACQ